MRTRPISTFIIMILFFSSAQAQKKKDCLTLAKAQLHDTYEHMINIFKKVDSQAGDTPCRAKKNTMTQAEWKKIKSQIWSNKKYRNTNPNAECNARATLLSVELDRLGYKSEKIHIEGNKIAALVKLASGYAVYPYTNHTANVVTMLDEDGKEKKYVLDPMFTDDLIPIDHYLANLGCPDGVPLGYTISSQTSEPLYEQLTGKRTEQCVYRNVIVQGSEKLVQINTKVEKEAGGGRLYSGDVDELVSIFGQDKETAKNNYCTDDIFK